VGQNVPAEIHREHATGADAPRRRFMYTATKPGPVPMAAWLLIVFAGLVLTNMGVSTVRAVATGADWSFTLLLVVVVAVAARSLWIGMRWAWWLAVALAAAGLFFVLPVTVTILLGGSTEPVGTGWDIVFFPLTTTVLAGLVSALWLRRTPAG
jgi:hypothetical protein